MNIGFYTAKSGVLSMQKALDVTSNNIANVETTGYKPLRASFFDLMYTRRNLAEEDVEVGHGVKVEKTDLLFDAGGLKQTHRELDFAIVGEGLFAFELENGDITYSKNGELHMQQDPDDQTWYIVDSKGNYALNGELERIPATFYDTVPEDYEPQYDENGEEIPYSQPLNNSQSNLNTGLVLEQLGVFKFPNPQGLRLEGNHYFSPTASSGEAEAIVINPVEYGEDETLQIDPETGEEVDNRVADTAGLKRKGYVEVSSANIADEMVNLIQFQRAFSLNSKLLQTHDELQNVVNGLR